MLSCVVGLWFAAVGQLPAEADWLKVVPADIPVVARVRALEDVRGDLLGMLKAMSPNLAAAAQGGVEQGLQTFEGMFGEAAGKNPFFVMLRLPDPAQPGPPAWGVIVKASDYLGVIKNLAQQPGEKPKALDGYDSFTGKDGSAWYAVKGAGWVAFGPDQEMIKSVQNPKANLNDTLSADTKTAWMAGDVGLYLNISGIYKKYGETIKGLKPMLMAQIEQANAAQGAQNVENMKKMVDAMIDALAIGDGLVVSLDFDNSAFTLAGLATVKPGTSAAKSLATAKTDAGLLLANLPQDMLMYISAGESFGAASPMQNANALSGAKTSPALTKATAARAAALEGKQVMGVALTPLRFLSLATPSDPQAAAKASLAADEARKALGEGEMTIDPNALTHNGFTLTRVKTKLDAKVFDQMKKARADVANFEQILKVIMPSDTITAYTGTDGKVFVSTVSPSDEAAKAVIDAAKDGGTGVGSLPAWRSLRTSFPEKTTFLLMLNAQETVKTIFKVVAGIGGNPNVKPAADASQPPAFLGFGLVSSPRGHDFKLVIPSAVGPVFEKGLAPLAGAQ